MAWEPDYVTLAQAKVHLGLTDGTDEAQNAADNAKLARHITAASRAIDRFCNRQFGQLATAEARYYTPWYDEDLRRWVCEIDDTTATPDFAVALDLGDDDTYSTTLSASDWILRPRNAASKNRPYTQLAIKSSASQPMRRSDSVRAVEKWGWAGIPTTIEDAVLLQVNRLKFRETAPQGVAGSPSQGSEIRLLAKLDPDVEVMVQAYRRLVKA